MNIRMQICITLLLYTYHTSLTTYATCCPSHDKV